MTSPIARTLPQIAGFTHRPTRTFQMGAADLHKTYKNCKPHQVTVSEHLFGETQVTVGDWKKYVEWCTAQPKWALQSTTADGAPSALATGNDAAALVQDHILAVAAHLVAGAQIAVVPTPESQVRMPALREGFDVDDHSMVNVTWAEARAYAAWRTGVERAVLGRSDFVIRLATEAEWEEATNGKKFATASGDKLEGEARYGLSWKEGTTGPVKEFDPNGEVYGQSGNVWEWTEDSYQPDNTTLPSQDPVCRVGDDRVVRGGSFYNGVVLCRAAFRYDFHPDVAYLVVGLRLVVVAAQDS